MMRGIAIAAAALVLTGQAAPLAPVVAVWASAQQAPDARNTVAPALLANATLRQVVRITAGAQRVTLRFSNLFGTAPLRIDSVHLARAVAPGSAGIVAGSDRTVRFAGADAVDLPPGADLWSDPVDLPVAALDSLAVTLHLPAAPDAPTGHTAAHATTWVLPGNHATDADLSGATRMEHWLNLAGVAVEGGARGTIVAFGDSITDGSATMVDRNQRWPDILAQRLQADPRTRGLAIVNEGIGGNRVLLDGNGPSALARFDRDVLAQPGVRAVILLEGINDIGTLTRQGAVSVAAHVDLVRRLTGGYAQIVLRAHQHGIRVIGATLLPFAGAQAWQPAGEVDRAAVNAWLRAAGHVDALIDFDAVTRDPAHPERLLPANDSGDHLHPSPEGYRAMGTAIPLALFVG